MSLVDIIVISPPQELHRIVIRIVTSCCVDFQIGYWNRYQRLEINHSDHLMSQK